MAAVIPAVAAAAKWVWAAKTLTAAAVKFVALQAVTYAVSRALAPRGGAPSVRAQATEVNVRDPAAPRSIVYGQRTIGGVFYPVGVSGTNNEYLHVLILLAGHEVDTLGDVFFNDELIGLDGSGNATGRYAGYVRIKKHLGAYNQTVDTDLQADLGSGDWTNDHCGKGVAYLYIRFKHGSELWATGMPEIKCTVLGRKVYDPRDGGQTVSDPSTYVYSANAALCLADYLMGVPGKNSAGTMIRPYGLGAEYAEVDATALTEAANTSDEAVVLADTSTEARYHAHGVMPSSTLPGDGIDSLRFAMLGDCVFIGGKWVIRAGSYRTPTVTLDEGDLRAPLSGVVLKPDIRTLCNGIKGVFVSEENNDMPADFPAVTNGTYLIEDAGERSWKDIELPFTKSPAMAQRIAKVIMEQSRQGIALTMRCKLTAMQNQCTDVVLVDNTLLGWSAKPFEVVGFRFVSEDDGNGNPYLGVDLDLRETAAGVWDWNDGEETTVDLAPNTTLPDPFTVPTPATPTLATGTAEVLRQNDGVVVPRVKVTMTPPTNTYALTGKVIIEYKKSTESDWLFWNDPIGSATVDWITDVRVGTTLQVRLKYVNSNGTPGAYSATASIVVAGDTTTQPADLTGGAFSGQGVPPKPNPVDALQLPFLGTVVSWTPSTDPELAYYEIKSVSTNNSASITYTWGTQNANENQPYRTLKPYIYLYVSLQSPLAGWTFIRQVNRSGVAGNWVLVGNALASSSNYTSKVPYEKNLTSAATGEYYAQAYAAVGDGTADDLASLDAMVTAAPAGGELILPPGQTFRVSAVWTISKKLHVIGYGSKIKVTADALDPTTFPAMVKLTADGVILEGVEFDGARSADTLGLDKGTLVRVEASGCQFLNCIFHDPPGCAIDAIGARHRGKVSGCEFYNCFLGIFLDNATTNIPTYWRISGNIMRAGLSTGSLSGGIKMSGNGSANSHDGHVIADNIIDGTGEMGIELQTWVNGCTITGNSVYNVTYGISVSGCANCVVTGNVLKGCADYGIELAGSGGGLRNTVSGNTVDGANTSGTATTDRGIMVNNQDYTSVTGNTIRNCTVWQIEVVDSTFCVASSNMSIGVGWEIKNSTDVSFIGNVIEITGTVASFITFDSTDVAITRCIISSNRFKGSVTAKGIDMYSPANSITHVLIEGNDSSNANAAGFMFGRTVSGSGSVSKIELRDNKGSGAGFDANLNLPMWNVSADKNLDETMLHLIVDCAGANKTITLPATPADMPGKRFRITKKDGGASTVTLARNGKTINGAASDVVLGTQWKYVEVESDEANWVIVDQN